MRLIDADELEELLVGDIEWIKQKYGSELSDLKKFNLGVIAATRQDLSYVQNAPTIEAIPIEWLKENLIGSEFYFGKGVDNTLVGETVWEMIVDAWKEDNGDEWWREEQSDE